MTEQTTIAKHTQLVLDAVERANDAVGSIAQTMGAILQLIAQLIEEDIYMDLPPSEGLEQ